MQWDGNVISLILFWFKYSMPKDVQGDQKWCKQCNIYSVFIVFNLINKIFRKFYNIFIIWWLFKSSSVLIYTIFILVKKNIKVNLLLD